MAGRKSAKSAGLLLPVSVVGPTDVVRLVRELEALDDVMLQMELREAGTPAAKLPKTSKLLDQMAHENGLNLLTKEDRTGLRLYLEDIRKHAPVMNISFSSDPSASFLDRLMSWLRQEIHPSVLLTIGLQPNIGAGCIVRTTNKQFDFSLRQDFANKRELLLKRIAGETS
jgi:hypothetical protein